MLPRALLSKFILKHSTVSPFQFNQQRALHSRNKKALEFIAKGWNALKEVDRVIDYSDPKHSGIVSLLRTIKENFELALEADNTNIHARYWLSRVHMKYPVPGANKAVGAALLVEAAEMGDPEAQYALGCHLRVEIADISQVLAVNVLTSDKREIQLSPDEVVTTIDPQKVEILQRYLQWLIEDQDCNDTQLHTLYALSLAKSAIEAFESENIF